MKMKEQEQDKLTRNYLKVLGLIVEEGEPECRKPGCDPECDPEDDGCDGAEEVKKSCRTRKSRKSCRCGGENEDETTINEAEGDEAEAEDDDEAEDERDPFDYDLFPDDYEDETPKENLDAELTDVITQMVDNGEIGEDEADGYYDRLHSALDKDSADISEEDAEYWLNLVKSDGEAAKKLAKLITAIGRCE